MLLFGNVVQSWGVPWQDKLNAYAASQAGADEHWIGSDVAWITFGLGMLVLLAGGHHRRTRSAPRPHRPGVARPIYRHGRCRRAGEEPLRIGFGIP